MTTSFEKTPALIKATDEIVTKLAAELLCVGFDFHNILEANKFIQYFEFIDRKTRQYKYLGKVYLRVCQQIKRTKMICECLCNVKKNSYRWIDQFIVLAA